MKKILITFTCLLMSVMASYAQENNLWHDPGFEETDVDRNDNITSKYWKLGGAMIGMFNTVQGTENVHGGSRAIKIFGSEANNLGIYDDAWNWDRSYKAKTGDNFTFSYWHKGTMSIPAMKVKIRLYKVGQTYNNFFAEREIPASEVTTSSDWQQKVVNFVINDEGVDHFDLVLLAPNSLSEQGYIILDDFSLVHSVAAQPAPSLAVPNITKAYGFQREIELAWEESEVEGVSYELMLDDNVLGTIEQNEIVLPGLEPDTSYTVKIRAVKEGMTSSEYVTKQISTDRIQKAQNADNRVPYLRTIAPDGSVHNKTLDLYYNDLYNANARITIQGGSGVEENKEEGYLTFANVGKYVLKIFITEDAEHSWVLTYNINVVD